MDQSPLQVWDYFKYCRNCGIRLPAHGIVCPRCRHPKPFGRLRRKLSICFSVVVIIFAILSQLNESSKHSDKPSNSTPASESSPPVPPPSTTPIQVRRAESVTASASASVPTPVATVRAAMPVQLYTVVGPPNQQSLNVRKGPGSNYDIVDKLWSDQANIQIIDTSVMNGPTEWVHIRYNNQSGWVNKQFLRAS